MDSALPTFALRALTLPLRTAGGVLALARDLAALPARLAELADALAVLPEIRAQLGRIEDALAEAALLPDELQGSLGEMPETVRALDAAVARLLVVIEDLAGSAARVDGADAPIDPDLETVATAADRVGQLAGRLRVRRRRFARPAV